MSDTEKSIYYGHLLREFADTIESAGGVRMSGATRSGRTWGSCTGTSARPSTGR